MMPEERRDYREIKRHDPDDAEEALSEWLDWMTYATTDAGDIIIIEEVEHETFLRYSTREENGYTVITPETSNISNFPFDEDFLDILNNCGVQSIREWKIAGYPTLFDNLGHEIRCRPLYAVTVL